MKRPPPFATKSKNYVLLLLRVGKPSASLRWGTGSGYSGLDLLEIV